MKIQNLKDLKLALKDIPEEDLDSFGFNYNSEGEEVALLCWDDKDPNEKYSEVLEKYPQVLDINKWVKAIIQQGVKADLQEIEEDPEEMISSEDFK